MCRTSFQETAEKLRFSFPSALRAPAALELKRYVKKLDLIIILAYI
jgi:hypothetical protein